VGKYKRLLPVVVYRMRVYLASMVLGEPIFTDYQEIRHKILNSAVSIKGIAWECKKCDKVKYVNIDERCKIISEEAAKLQ